MDMIFSFWVLTPLPDSLPKNLTKKTMLHEVGICYLCSCPHFNHYHVCKHVLAMGMTKKMVNVPKKFSTETAGKRKATAGASPPKRPKCLSIDK